MLISHWKKQAFLLTSLCCLTCLSPLTLPALNAQAADSRLDFTQVAKKAIPAVVSIKVETNKNKTKVKSSRFNPWGQYEDEDDTTAEFWQRFFGLPFEEKNPKQPSTGQASGFIVSADGYILTNNHVVQDADTITVTLNDSQELAGKVIGQDSNTDIALIKIEGKNFPFLELGNSDNLEVAQPIMAIGTPLGLQATVTVGVVSAKKRNNLDLARIEDFIQTDAAINRGNSGGPLLNLQGEVIGVNTAIASNMGGNMGIGFAVPSNIAKSVMEQLISKGSVSRSFIGVELQPIDANLANAFGLSKPEGALVAQVVKDSPAEKANINQGDVIVKYDDTPVASVGGLRTSIALMKPGTKVKLSLLRDGKPLEVYVETADFATVLEEKTLPESSFTAESALGISVSNLTPEIAAQLRLSENSGVLVTRVDQGSIAYFAGLRKGTLILGVNRKKVENIAQFKREISQADKSKPLLLLVKEGNSVRYLSFKIG